jgi:hypothetical protein
MGNPWGANGEGQIRANIGSAFYTRIVMFENAVGQHLPKMSEARRDSFKTQGTRRLMEALRPFLEGCSSADQLRAGPDLGHRNL